MSDNFVTIGDLEQLSSLADSHKLLIDDSTEGDTKSASVSVLKDYLVADITPRIDEDTMTWFVGDTNTGISVDSGIGIWTAGENYKLDTFVYNDTKIYKCIKSPQEDLNTFNITEWEAVSSNIEYATDEEITSIVNSIWGISVEEE